MSTAASSARVVQRAGRATSVKRALHLAAKGPECIAPERWVSFPAFTGTFPAPPGRELFEATPSIHALWLSLPHNIWSEHSTLGVQLAAVSPVGVGHDLAHLLARGASRASQLVGQVLAAKAKLASADGAGVESYNLGRLLVLVTLAGAPGRILSMKRPSTSTSMSMSMSMSMRNIDPWLEYRLSEANREEAWFQLILKLHSPPRLAKALTAKLQVGFGSCFWAAYKVSPRFCKSFNGYIDEEIINTLMELRASPGPLSRSEASVPPSLAERYELPPGANFQKVFECMLEEAMLSR